MATNWNTFGSDSKISQYAPVPVHGPASGLNSFTIIFKPNYMSEMSVKLDHKEGDFENNIVRVRVEMPAPNLSPADKLFIVNDWIKSGEVDSNVVSDGYHTFRELYEHRIRLWIAFCKLVYDRFDRKSIPVWCSKKHSDGSEYDGWFLLGIHFDQGKQVTYHLPNKYWDDVQCFAEEIIQAPPFDGHTSADVLERIKNLL